MVISIIAVDGLQTVSTGQCAEPLRYSIVCAFKLSQRIARRRQPAKRIVGRGLNRAVDRLVNYPAQLVIGEGDRVVRQRPIDTFQSSCAEIRRRIVRMIRVGGQTSTVHHRRHPIVIRIVSVVD